MIEGKFIYGLSFINNFANLKTSDRFYKIFRSLFKKKFYKEIILPLENHIKLMCNKRDDYAT